MNHIFRIGITIFLTFTQVSAASLYTPVEYMTTWREVAIAQMIQFKIPASITMAQGMLESGNGNSDLAIKAKNHFGIKCHNWSGEKLYMDDDQKGECFRSYASVDESFLDHSKFLTERSRYASLFALDITDYKGWAQGLKDAGYATNPKYPQLLIELIERLNLAELDQEGNNGSKPNWNLLTLKTGSIEKTHTLKEHANKVKFIVAKKGDTFYRISQEFSVSLRQLYKYNDYSKHKEFLEEGDIIYLQPKKRKSKSTEIYPVTIPISLRSIAQLEAIKLDVLMRKNNISSPDELLPKGEKIHLK